VASDGYAANPETFAIPNLHERMSQQIGDQVKLLFVLRNPVVDGPRAERMWVQISSALSSTGDYIGVLTNRPTHIRDLNPGDVITFKPCHIAATIIRTSDPRRVSCAEQKALVSAMVFKTGERMRFAYREAPDHDEDSGWRMFTGHESQDYNDDPGNIRVCIVGALLDRDPSLYDFIREPAGAVFERRVDGDPWVRVTDWQPSEEE